MYCLLRILFYIIFPKSVVIARLPCATSHYLDHVARLHTTKTLKIPLRFSIPLPNQSFKKLGPSLDRHFGYSIATRSYLQKIVYLSSPYDIRVRTEHHHLCDCDFTRSSYQRKEIVQSWSFSSQ